MTISMVISIAARSIAHNNSNGGMLSATARAAHALASHGANLPRAPLFISRKSNGGKRMKAWRSYRKRKSIWRHGVSGISYGAFARRQVIGVFITFSLRR
jgi:hypothetical protein